MPLPPVLPTASVDSNGTMGDPPPLRTRYRLVNDEVNCISALEIEVPDATAASISGMNAAALVYPPALITGDKPLKVVPVQLV